MEADQIGPNQPECQLAGRPTSLGQLSAFKLSASRGASRVPIGKGLGLEAVDAIAEDPRFQSSDAIRPRSDQRHSHPKPQASPVKVEVDLGRALCRQQALDQARPEPLPARLLNRRSVVLRPLKLQPSCATNVPHILYRQDCLGDLGVGCLGGPTCRE